VGFPLSGAHGTAAPRAEPLGTYPEALDYLFARTTGGFKFGLERTIALLERLGNPQTRYPAFHIAGTNGKGSAVATIAALLTAKGMRVGTYTSPHLVDFRERIAVDGVPIPADDVIAFIARRTADVEELGASFFEATTAMAFEHFARAGVAVAVVEAGLGGRLDSTNVLLPVAAGVTSIGFDHTEYLGETLEAIAGEKAGIFKRGRGAVIGEPDPDTRLLLAGTAERAGAADIRVVADVARIADVEVRDDGTAFTLEMGGEKARLHTPLAGRHQAANTAFAIAMLDVAGETFRVSLHEAAAHLDKVRLPGRFQHIGRYIFDVAHNPGGASELARTIVAVRPPSPVSAVLCVLRDKNWREMILALRGAVSHFVLTMAPTAPVGRAWDIDEAFGFARQAGISVEAVVDFDTALARGVATGETVLVTGSFHTVGDAMARLQVSPLAG
jgi:dihydrofolate synthase / folylpolyglutamate synthase